MNADTYKATPAVWRKRVLQVPKFQFDPRMWLFGVCWDAPEDEGFFSIHFGPFALGWDIWP